MADLISGNLDADMKNSWRTDPEVFKALNREFNFSIDVAADPINSLCEHWYSALHDALTNDWAEMLMQIELHMSAFCNPPYGRGMIEKFMQKAIEQKHKGVTTVMLVPATLDAQWLPVNDISEIRIITGGRLSFYHPINNKKVNGNTKGSMFVIFRPSIMPCVVRLIDRNELLGTKKRLKVAA